MCDVHGVAWASLAARSMGHMNTAAAGSGPEIHRVPGARFPPGPRLLPRVLTGSAFRADPVEVLRENARQYGDLVHFRGWEGHIFQFNHPDLIREIFVEHERQNRRALVMQRARALLGDGLLTSEEPLHMRQRRLAAPAFHRQRIGAYGDVIGRYAEEVTGTWREGVMDVHQHTLLLALRIVGKCLFNIDEVAEAKRIAGAVAQFMVQPPPGWIPYRLIEQLQKVPFGPMLRVRKGIDELDRILYGMIADRRREPGDRGDLLSMLMAAEDTETVESDDARVMPEEDRRMSDRQVRDECLTVLLAGHETTANALSFALWLVAKHPEAQEEGHREAVRVLGRRTATAADFSELRYIYGIFAEAMRLYPTVWVLGRSAGPEPYDFHGFTIPPGSMLLAPQSVVHRDPRFWRDPERFDPTRFVDEAGGGRSQSSRPKFAYFPFGGGSRQCIGEGLAWMEGALVLATVLRDWRLETTGELMLTPSVNLRPKRGVALRLERRG